MGLLNSPLANYWKGLVAPAQHLSFARRAVGAEAAGTGLGYAYSLLPTDSNYGEPQYANSGSFSAVLPAWMNSIAGIDPSWLWTAADNAAAGVRGAESAAQNAWFQAAMQTVAYSGSAIDVLGQRYAKTVFDPAIFSAPTTAAMTEHWAADDAEFARQRLGGSNPDVIARYQGSDDDLAGWLAAAAGTHDAGALLASLKSANGAGQLFVCDYTRALGKVVPDKYVRSGQYFAAPLAFFQASGGALQPLAIQLDVAGKGYVFTPQDDANSWLLAKLWVNSADAQWWFSGTHLFNTHTVVMQFAIAAAQLEAAGTLAGTHPVLTLLKPHLVKVFNINNLVYNLQADTDNNPGIYQKDSFCDQFLPTGRIGLYQIVSSLFASYDFDAAAFDSSIASRGIDATSLPVSFPYRDDGLLWWKAIEDFVGEVVEGAYGNDAAVAADSALNAWFGAVQAAFNHDGVVRYTWTPTLAGLVRTATNLFFTASVQHTAVNNSMFPHWGYLPNGAFAMTAPPPVAAGVTDAQLLASLPDPKQQTTLLDASGAPTNVYGWPIQNQIGFVIAGTSAVDEVVAGIGSAGSLQAAYAGFESGGVAGNALYRAVANFHAALWAGDQSVARRVAQNQAARAAAFRQANPAAATVPNSVAYPYLSVSVAPPTDLNAPVMSAIQI